MDIGVSLPTSGPLVSREAIVRVAEEAERLGYAALWTYERLLYPTEGITYPGGDTKVPLDKYYLQTFAPLETLAHVAAKTSRIKLGTSIINTPFHAPAVLARSFATLDQFSDGRVIAAGLGQGWMEEEFITTNSSRKYQGPGVNEFVAAMRASWGANPVKFEGRFYNIPSSNIDPKPIQKGGIPIIMGVATPGAMKRAARIADGLNPVGMSFEMLEGTINTFRSAAEEAGRDPSKLMIVVRVNGPITTAALPEDGRQFLAGSPDQIARDLDSIRKLNIDHVFFNETVTPATANQTPNLDEYINNLARLQSVVRA